MTDTLKPLHKIVILGGGTAGWITACLLAKQHDANSGNIKVTLIESDRIGTIGVGEGTWPTMRNTLKKIGIAESDFIQYCQASFKQGSKFIGWRNGNQWDQYYHPFSPPRGALANPSIDLAPLWNENQDNSFAESVSIQQQICDMGLAPKTITHGEYQGALNYGYHLDAGKFAELLKEHGINNLGVQHIVDDVKSVNNDSNGDIKSLKTDANGDLEGDLFIDCSGFAAILIGEHYNVPFQSLNDVLFVDRALAIQVPQEKEHPIACQTNSTAQDAGWIWDIGLQNRRGVGYVYSSSHCSQEKAITTLATYLNQSPEQITARQININSGYRSRFWQNNCVSVGLSAGFLEPLEASALMLIELSAEMISDRLPACRRVMDRVANQFNQTFQYRWQRILDFLKLHYVLSQRADSDFWLDNRQENSIPDSLLERLELWRYHPPSRYDFEHNSEVFSWASYQYVLYGMGYQTEYGFREHTRLDLKLADHLFTANKISLNQATSVLPKHRELIDKVLTFGFQKQ